VITSSLCTKLRIVFDILCLLPIYLLFRFDHWHLVSPSSRRPYQRHIAEIVSSFSPDSCLEIGCGLGNIISKIKCRQRYGLDTSSSVIAAARLIHFLKPNLIFSSASIPIKGNHIDFIISLNFLHDMLPSEVEEFLIHITYKFSPSFIFIDEVPKQHTSSSGYKYSHSPRQFLKPLGYDICFTYNFPNESKNFYLFSRNENG